MDRFWEKVNRGDENACWPWLGAKRNGGYGAFWLRGKLELAHAEEDMGACAVIHKPRVNSAPLRPMLEASTRRAT